MVVASFRQRRHWGFILGVGLGFAFWMGSWVWALRILVEAISELPDSLVEVLFIGVWAVVWTAGAFALLCVSAYNVAGRQTVSLTHDALEIRRAVGPIGLTRRYPREGIGDFRADPADDDGYHVVFSHGDRTVEFGERLDQVAAENLVLSLRAML